MGVVHWVDGYGYRTLCAEPFCLLPRDRLSAAFERLRRSLNLFEMSSKFLAAYSTCFSFGIHQQLLFGDFQINLAEFLSEPKGNTSRNGREQTETVARDAVRV